MARPSFRLSTLILSIVIVAFALALVIRDNRASRCEALLRKQVSKALRDLRDAQMQEVMAREHIFLLLIQTKRTKADPEVQAAVSRLKSSRSTFDRTFKQLRGFPE